MTFLIPRKEAIMTRSIPRLIILIVSSMCFYQPARACDHCKNHDGHEEGGHSHDANHSHDHAKTTKVMDKNLSKQNLFGTALNPKAEKIELADLIAQPSRHYHKTVQVQGTVDNVCSEKGCWLALKKGDQDLRVKFKDYGFFVPQNIRGKNVKVEGELVEKSIDEQIEGTQEVRQKKQVFFVASGVEIIKETESSTTSKKSL